MNRLRIFSILFLWGMAAFLTVPVDAAKDCSLPPTGFTPLIDMSGTQTYKGQEGGLYDNGSNSVPSGLYQKVLEAASQIQPVNGKIGLISVGMSNVSQEFIDFQSKAEVDPEVSAAVVTVNGAQSGQSADKWVTPDPGTNPWSVLASRISSSGLSNGQVQAVWLKQANRGTIETPGLEDALEMKSNLAYIVKKLRTDYPAIKVIYVSSRIYAGYVGSAHSSIEPLAYESGFAFRWLIQDQMGVANAAGTGEVDYVNAPVIVWGPYLWADDNIPRSDGLIWKCEDFEDDGGHPGPGAEAKVAQMLLNFFKTSPMAASWFTGSAPVPTKTPSKTPTPIKSPTKTPTQPPTPPMGKPGDANGDGKVDGFDYLVWLSHYGQTSNNGPIDGDFNSDGSVNGQDYLVWLSNYGT